MRHLRPRESATKRRHGHLLAVLMLTALLLAMGTSGRARAQTPATITAQACLSILGYSNENDLRADLLAEAKLALAAQLFGEVISADRRTEDGVLVHDEAQSYVLGLVRTVGSPRYFSGSALGEGCVEIVGYATAADLARLLPVPIKASLCHSDPSLGRDLLRSVTVDLTLVRALTDHDRRLSNLVPTEVLALARQVSVSGAEYTSTTRTWCLDVDAQVIPVEVELLLRSSAALTVSVATPTPDATATLTAETTRIAAVVAQMNADANATAQALAVKLTARAPRATPSPTRPPAMARVQTPTLAPTATRAVAARNAKVDTDTLNLRATPNSQAAILAKLPQGALLNVLEVTIDLAWLHVRTEGGDEGWVASEYTLTGLPLEEYPVAPLSATVAAATAPAAAAPAPVAAAPSAPASCAVAVDGRLADLWNPSALGCASQGAALTWASWTPYERGQVIWRADTNSVYGFYNSGWWQRLTDTWDGSSTAPSRGSPPAGLLAPERGTGWVWGTNDSHFNELGWATVQQRGFCALVQPFERGFLLRSNNVEFCRDTLYNHAREGNWPLDAITAVSGGAWSARYR